MGEKEKKLEKVKVLNMNVWENNQFEIIKNNIK
jgi:hypothetical protein